MSKGSESRLCYRQSYSPLPDVLSCLSLVPRSLRNNLLSGGLLEGMLGVAFFLFFFFCHQLELLDTYAYPLQIKYHRDTSNS